MICSDLEVLSKAPLAGRVTSAECGVALFSQPHERDRVLYETLKRQKSGLLFPGIPYSAAPTWSFDIEEWRMLAMLLLCAIYAVRTGRQGALQCLLGGVLCSSCSNTWNS